MDSQPPRDFPPFDFAATRSVGVMTTWEGQFWRWDGQTWVHVERVETQDQESR